jgi:hypothetical protein
VRCTIGMASYDTRHGLKGAYVPNAVSYRCCAACHTWTISDPSRLDPVGQEIVAVCEVDQSLPFRQFSSSTSRARCSEWGGGHCASATQAFFCRRAGLTEHQIEPALRACGDVEVDAYLHHS